jgi:putative PIN family toxin of toxin-antitoxin system
VVVSALLFRGKVSLLHALWKKKAFTIIASKEIVGEHLRVLAYPRFNLTEMEIQDIVREELLPYIEPAEPARTTAGGCKDPDYDKFLACAEATKADFIVSGDAHLLNMKKYKGRHIVTAESFLKKFE